jgi:hypothetical protein
VDPTRQDLDVAHEAGRTSPRAKGIDPRAEDRQALFRELWLRAHLFHRRAQVVLVRLELGGELTKEPTHVSRMPFGATPNQIDREDRAGEMVVEIVAKCRPVHVSHAKLRVGRRERSLPRPHPVAEVLVEQRQCIHPQTLPQAAGWRPLVERSPSAAFCKRPIHPACGRLATISLL